MSLFCAYLSLLPQALVIVYATLLLATREAEVLLLFAGQLACEAANFVLKRLIKEARPARIPGKGYGMPSSHAQFVAFWSVSVGLFLLVRYRPAAARGVAPGSQGKKGPGEGAVPCGIPLPARLVASALALAVAGAVAASRIYLSYHTTRQVMAGLAAGTTCALAWFVLTAAARSSGMLYRVLVSPLGRMLLLRDLVVEEDPCWAGWERWEGMRKAREAEMARRAAVDTGTGETEAMSLVEEREDIKKVRERPGKGKKR